ncbi:hypothetical protein R1flu_015810 [Riccia fluitans]|uniref:Uncharacterized protein n=1 Tax=Riccia fluitans TaxID=41844 RepID=A0ABD1YL23_9MARC
MDPSCFETRVHVGPNSLGLNDESGRIDRTRVHMDSSHFGTQVRVNPVEGSTKWTRPPVHSVHPGGSKRIRSRRPILGRIDPNPRENNPLEFNPPEENNPLVSDRITSVSNT